MLQENLHNAEQEQSTQSSQSDASSYDIASLAAMLADTAQALLELDKMPKANFKPSASPDLRPDLMCIITRLNNMAHLMIEEYKVHYLGLAKQDKQAKRVKQSVQLATDIEQVKTDGKYIQFWYEHGENDFLNSKLDRLIKDGYERGEFEPEIRSFHVPDYVVREEYQMLHHYKQDNIFILAHSLCEELLGITALINNLDETLDIPAAELLLTGGSLARSLGFLRDICLQLSESSLIYKAVVSK